MLPEQKASTTYVKQFLKLSVSVELVGTSPDERFNSGLFSTTASTGDAGDLRVKTGQLIVRDGGSVSTSALSQSQRQGGNLTVTASDSVELSGTSPRGRLRSGLGSQTRGTGAAGNLTIETGRLIVRDGGFVSANTYSEGQGGTLTVIASDSVQLNRISADGRFFSFLSSAALGAGNAKNLRIQTGQLIVRDGAQVIASSEGTGDAGNIEVSASSIRLDNQALLSADTTAGQGNIFLRSQDLVLRRGSNITTNASGTVTGGNITIDTGVLTASQNSDISANAEEAFGGRIIVKAQGIFGTQFGNQLTAESDITATSNLGPEFSGSVEINTPDVDPSRGLVNLPTVPIETEVVQACRPGGTQQQSEFVITGRGGLPPTPREVLGIDVAELDWVTLNPRRENNSTSDVGTNPAATMPIQIVEAQGWVIAPNGKVILTASAPTVTSNSPWQSSTDCRALQSFSQD